MNCRSWSRSRRSVQGVEILQRIGLWAKTGKSILRWSLWRNYEKLGSEQNKSRQTKIQGMASLWWRWFALCATAAPSCLSGEKMCKRKPKDEETRKSVYDSHPINSRPCCGSKSRRGTAFAESFRRRPASPLRPWTEPTTRSVDIEWKRKRKNDESIQAIDGRARKRMYVQK